MKIGNQKELAALAFALAFLSVSDAGVNKI